MTLNDTPGPQYPSDITFKAIFRSGHETVGMLKQIFTDSGLESVIYCKKSSNGKFISYTITARFSSGEELSKVCAMIRSLEGFMTMF